MFSFKVLVQWPLFVRQRRLAISRPPMSKDKFVEVIASMEIGKHAAGLLWDKLVDLILYSEFTPYPDDDLLVVFGLAEEDLDEDIILAIINSVGARHPNENFMREFGSVNTPSDIIRLIESSSKAS